MDPTHLICSGYNSKTFEVEDPVLELWEIWITLFIVFTPSSTQIWGCSIVECSLMIQETGVYFQVESYQRLKKCTWFHIAYHLVLFG